MYTTSQAASAVGVHRDTLLRWLRQNLISEPDRDRHGWRRFSEDDLQTIKDFANGTERDSLAPGKLKEVSEREIIHSLKNIDWNFSDAKTNYLTHSIHPYPAKFIPQIPNALIQELSSIGDTVLDIFCGSGTTLIEALLLKRNAIGIDANPLACLISEAKTSTISENEYNTLECIIDKANEYASSASLSLPNLFHDELFSSKEWRPDHDAVSFWFEPFIVEELAEILSWCKSLHNKKIRTIALCAFSSIVVTVSKQDSDTRYVRREKKIGPGDAFSRFAKSLRKTLTAIMELSDVIEPRFFKKIINHDLLNSPPIEKCDLVVCSPPYPNAFSYHLYHMTRMLWLDMNQPEFKKREIGSHRKYSSTSKNRATIETFKNEFSVIMNWLKTIVKIGGHACFVVGNSKLKGEIYNNNKIISDISAKNGFTEVTQIKRSLNSTRKAFNPSHGRIKEEFILVLRRQD